MKRAFIIFCACLLVLGLSGCESRGREYVYLSGEVLCEVSFSLERVTYRAEIERLDSGCRIYFHEPPSLSALTLTSDGESFRAELSGIEVSGEAYAGLFEVARFFEYGTRVLASELYGGAERLTLERSTGERFSLFVTDGMPSRIEGELYGERREIRLLRVEGEMLGERK